LCLGQNSKRQERQMFSPTIKVKTQIRHRNKKWVYNAKHKSCKIWGKDKAIKCKDNPVACKCICSLMGYGSEWPMKGDIYDTASKSLSGSEAGTR
jgi:hypothetical protein